MFDAHRRPVGRLFCLLAFLLGSLGVSLSQTPDTSTISDFVYRADGSLAGGTLLISCRLSALPQDSRLPLEERA
jgi:hypothetical protein